MEMREWGQEGLDRTEGQAGMWFCCVRPTRGSMLVGSDRWEMLVDQKFWGRNWPIPFLVGLLGLSVTGTAGVLGFSGTI